MKAKVKKLALKGFSRVIAISDLHGSLSLFEKLLEKVGFCERDALLLLGDYIERGEENLPLLRKLMKMAKEPNVFLLMGNCDTLGADVLYARYHKKILDYMLQRKESLLNEMCVEIGYPVGSDTDEIQLRRMLAENFSEEIRFLMELPHILESEDFIFVHAGLLDCPLDEQSAEYCMTVRGFLENAPTFEKYVVVGHWPTINYAELRGGILSHEPYWDPERKILSIDGGNRVKGSGQLNAMIYADGCFYFERADDLPEKTVSSDQTASEDPFSIVWVYSDVEILQWGEEKSLVRHIRSGKELWLENEYLHDRKGDRAISADFTDYRLPLKAGDRVSLPEGDTKYPLLVKHKGILGYCLQPLL